MLNIKWGGIAAGAAFALALALSLLLGQTSLSIALLRAVIFAALFFALGAGACLLISTFIPELLSSSGARDIATHLFSPGPAGSRVNITVDDAQNADSPAALPEQDHDVRGDGAVGDFNELFSSKITTREDSQDIDQIPATSYTEEGETKEFASATEEFSSTFDDVNLHDEDEADEFSVDFNAFIPSGLDGDGTTGESESEEEQDSDSDPFLFFPETTGSSNFEEKPDVPEQKVTRNKTMKLEGDFNAKEIAAGLRTVLEKDKK